MNKLTPSFPFSYVYCVSLVESVGRRQWISRELKQNNISDYKFIDAVNENDQIVEDAYESGIVKLYPPCFRCGKEVCHCENNVLIKTQVATFYSHMKVWEVIARQKEGMYLIIEDDIKFNRHYKFLKSVFHSKINGFLNRMTGIPLLLRLAWASNEEHKHQKIKLIDGLVKMSNPMYSINPDMAKILLESFTVIDTTVDVYVHSDIGEKYSNYTLMPPLAHELSYSLGEVESLVRPRPKRIEVLKKQNNDFSKSELNRYDNHIDRAIKRRLLVLGAPLINGSYPVEVLRSHGLDIYNDRMGNDGIVSWMFAVYDLNNPHHLNKYARSRYFVSFAKIILFAQDPYAVIPEIMHKSKQSNDSIGFIEKHIYKNYGINVSEIESDLERVVDIYYYWSKVIIEKNSPDLIVRIETDEDILVEFLEDNGFDIRLNEDDVQDSASKYNAEKNDKSLPLIDDWLALDGDYKLKLNELCESLGYRPIFDNSLLNIDR